MAGFPLFVSKTTTIGGGTSGSLVINNSAATPIFNGLVTLANGASWNNSGSSTVTFKNGLTISGTGNFNAGTGIHTFDTNDQATTGTLAIPSVTVNGVTLTNNNVLTISTALTGTGNLVQATGATLNLGFSGPSDINTLDAATNLNGVNYNMAGAQIVYPTTYQNLILSSSSVKSFIIEETINGCLLYTSPSPRD